MRITVLLGVVFLIILFAYPTKLKYKNNPINKENTIFITLQNNKKFDSQEDLIKASRKFNPQKNIKNSSDAFKNKNPITRSSRNKKGKIMYSKNRTILSGTKLK
ncbi:hypothetical protein [Flavobacterium sp. LB2R40]|uniref:hypothetical protein n=1 Tax=unclassified Flavobacterium TaxID=196869 RepID=UPI003AAD598B